MLHRSKKSGAATCCAYGAASKRKRSTEVMRKILAVLFVCAAGFPAATFAAASYDETFDSLMARYQLPGLAIGVIEDGKVTYVRTAGELEVGSGKAVTPDTLFKIASNSKAMT